MLYREIMAVCSEIHTKRIYTLCGQNVEFVNVKTGGTHSKSLKGLSQIGPEAYSLSPNPHILCNPKFHHRAHTQPFSLFETPTL